MPVGFYIRYLASYILDAHISSLRVTHEWAQADIEELKNILNLRVVSFLKLFLLQPTCGSR